MHVGHGVGARFHDRPGDVDSLAAEARYHHVDLGVFNIFGQPVCNEITNFSDLQAFDLDLANVGIKDASVVMNPVAGFFCATHGARRNGQLGMIPDGNLQHITDADDVVVTAGIDVEVSGGRGQRGLLLSL